MTGNDDVGSMECSVCEAVGDLCERIVEWWLWFRPKILSIIVVVEFGFLARSVFMLVLLIIAWR